MIINSRRRDVECDTVTICTKPSKKNRTAVGGRSRWTIVERTKNVAVGVRRNETSQRFSFRTGDTGDLSLRDYSRKTSR